MPDAPLLALTRRRGTPPGAPPEAIAAENMRQLIQLRWIAVAGQLVTILVVHYGLGAPLPLPPMLAAVALLAAVNLLAMLFASNRPVGNRDILLALLLDVGVLTFQLSLSGGADNPFVSLYLIQIALAAILLEAWSAWAMVALTAGCYALLTVQARPLAFPAGLLPATANLYMLAHWLGFVLAGLLLVVFITRISRNLRARDAYLADLRRQTAEEEGIVRMGLFASGAAHELGTPLATLDVILSDWKRMPAIAGDPDLSGEVAEMQAEVRRCKAIVADISHAAGEPRSEAMEREDAAAWLDRVAEAWRPTHPAVPLTYRRDALDGAVVIADPALRQAIWNLLDNAAEASPGGVELRAERRREMLAVTVADRGSGFAPGRLAAVGRLHQSTKGAGHGLGLFLATNVARRMGGRLEAANRDGGGAEVRLVIPLAAAGEVAA